MELKNQLTGQNIKNSEYQYKHNRNPKEPLLNFQRCFVHFCIDNDVVSMTTQLKGEKTRFLPYNKDISNPIVEGDYRTEYLWNNILTPNSVLDIIQNFLVVVEESEREWDDNDWDEADKEEYWNRFLDKLIPVKKGGKRGYWNKWRLIEINDQNLYIESTDPNDNKSIASCTAWGGKVKIHWPGSYQYTESSEEFVKDLKNALGDGVKNLTKNKFGVYDLEVNEKELKTLFNGTL
jgi:hypothetical protein